MTTVITTVHGTFARQAAWAQPDSPLSQYLTAHLGGAVRIAPFDWSGRNSFEARDDAAKRLGDHLEAIGRAEPDSRQFVVAHSHGGNVALLAAANGRLSKPVAGIVCLSTPFLQAWPRHLGAARIVSAAAGIVLLFANLLFLMLRHRVGSSLLMACVVVTAIPTIYIFIKAAATLTDNDKPRWVLPEMDPHRMLILRAAADEASAALGAATLASSLVARFWALTSVGAPLWMRALEQDEADRARQTRYSWLRRVHGLSVMCLFVLGIVLCVLSLLPIDPPWVTRNQATAVLVASFVLNLLFAWRKVLAIAVLAPLWWLSMLLAGPVLLLLSVFAMSFGSSLALRHFLWIVSAETTPPGVWMTVQLDPESTPRGFRGLMHSSLYDDPRAHSVIAHWMKKQTGVSPAAERRVGPAPRREA
ncbi:esterase/lipase family protein [Paraburkholderia tuberum]|uniref:Uncharacterized protein n=1 Tax=Paraburkholderia tuberum TaxID=157910 RepID=A0A1H1KF48_9BURK|nr:hypothetical protein [Paraburkholderia tuberum]SDR60968.1 hypothetical protein SAMN05445850_7474 [Paraburkholderia tuberum]